MILAQLIFEKTIFGVSIPSPMLRASLPAMTEVVGCGGTGDSSGIEILPPGDIISEN